MHAQVDHLRFFMYCFNAYIIVEAVTTMPRIAVEDNSRMSLRIRAEEKALLLRAVALNHTDLTDFVIRHALRAAKAVIEKNLRTVQRIAYLLGENAADSESILESIIETFESPEAGATGDDGDDDGAEPRAVPGSHAPGGTGGER